MPKYTLRYQTFIITSGFVSGVESLVFNADSFEDATLKVVDSVRKGSFSSDYRDIFNAEIRDSGGEVYEILKKGSWMIDFETGKRFE